MKRKSLAFLLAFLMLGATACGEPAADTTGDSQANAGTLTEEVVETEPEDTSVKTALPDDLDFAGASYRIHNVESTSYYDTLVAFEQIGDNLNDAIYLRDQKLMQDLNFKFEETVGNPDAHGALVQETRSMILAGDDSFDQYVLVDWSGYTLAQEGYAIPVTTLPYIDVTREYWSQSIHEDMSIRGKLYFAFGDHNLSTYDSVNVLLYNKAMSVDLNL